MNNETMIVNGPVSTPRPGGVVMSDTLRAKLTGSMKAATILALEAAMLNATSERSGSGWTYANAMERAFDEHGIDGVSMQVAYLLLYLRLWNGPDARESKKLLRKFTITPSQGR